MVYLAYDDQEMEAQTDGKRRITLSVLPKERGLPGQSPGWIVFVQVVLFAFTSFSAVRSLLSLLS